MLADYIDQASTSCIASPRCTAKIKIFLPRDLCFSIAFVARHVWDRQGMQLQRWGSVTIGSNPRLPCFLHGKKGHWRTSIQWDGGHLFLRRAFATRCFSSFFILLPSRTAEGLLAKRQSYTCSRGGSLIVSWYVFVAEVGPEFVKPPLDWFGYFRNSRPFMVKLM